MPNIKDDELLHYGVLGMKWGVRKASRKLSRNEKLANKALKYDVKSAKRAKKAESIHRIKDLDRATNMGVRAAKYEKKAAALTRKSHNESSIDKQLKYNKKAAKKSYKAAKLHTRGDKITKATGYGAKAMRQLTKSNRFAEKAAKARLKIAKNELYINATKKKVSEISKEDLDSAYAFVNDFMKRSN